MTVRQNLSCGLRATRRPAEEVAKRTAAMADLLQLMPLLHRPAKGLSVNILQRVAFRRSALMAPAIFLLDNPLSNIDAAFRAVMRTELNQLQRSFRHTMVYVIHDKLEAITMADRIAVMDRGVPQQVGSRLQIYNDPANLLVANVISSPRLNLLRGRPAKTAAGPVVDLGPMGHSLSMAQAQPLGGAMLRGQPEIRVGAQVGLGCDPARVMFFRAGGTALPRSMRGDAR
ncbi:MAG: hypothetical protein ACOH2H_06270 [Cypionkella sp.]